MTTERDARRKSQFVPVILPWLVAAGALLLYGLTLNHWVTFGGLPQVARASGSAWQAELYGPLAWLITLLGRLLPVKAVPLALNLFSALCASLTLGLLARSVALLPHDRTEEQRIRERSSFSLLSFRRSWIPPVFAAVVCGLQLTFWERATAVTGWPFPAAFPMASNQMFDLLLFAYIIRCLLEYRIDERESWLIRAALVCGLAMTNDWAIIGFFPVFLIALVWLRGLSFFNLRFLVRIALCVLAGLSLYLLLPLIQAASASSRISFWTALRANFQLQEYVLTALPFNRRAIFTGDNPLWVLGLPSLLPLLVISIRWPSYFGDPSKLGVALATSIFHIFHAVLLAVCIWTAVDPRFSPRHHPSLSNASIPGLPLYYLGALSVGYFVGYFLLVFGRRPLPPRTLPPSMRPVNAFVSVVLYLGLLFTPYLMLYRNLPEIRVTNGPLLRDYAASQIGAIPRGSSVVLADDVRRLRLAQAMAAQSNRLSDCLFLETASLKWPQYQTFLNQKFPSRWTNAPDKDATGAIGDLEIRNLVTSFAPSNNICYLHPSFGYYFEVFYPEPLGMLYDLILYPTNAVFPPALSKELLEKNEAFWNKTDQQILKPLVAAIAPARPVKKPGLMDLFMIRAHLTKEPNPMASALAVFYSRALVFWGVMLQRNDHPVEAALHFTRATELNPDNVVAQIDLEYNRNLQAGRKSSAQLTKYIEDQFGKYRNLEQVLNENGPFDDPTFCYPQALVLARGRNFRQAAHEFARVKALTPENLPARLWLAQLYLLDSLADRTIDEVNEIHTQADLLGLGRTNQTELLSIETAAYLTRKDLSHAEAAVSTALAKYPDDQELLGAATQTYMNYGCYSNALILLSHELRLQPDNASALVNKGFASLQLGDCAQAIPPLTRALELETNNYLARFNLSIAYLQCGQLDASQHSYEILQKAYPTFYKTYYGLGEIAWRRQDTNAAIRCYQLYLTNAPPGTEEARHISGRLAELQHPGAADRPAVSAKPSR